MSPEVSLCRTLFAWLKCSSTKFALVIKDLNTNHPGWADIVDPLSPAHFERVQEFLQSAKKQR